jgi:hypothetical protein
VLLELEQLNNRSFPLCNKRVKAYNVCSLIKMIPKHLMKCQMNDEIKEKEEEKIFEVIICEPVDGILKTRDQVMK